MDPHRARPGRAGARLYQMGRPAGFAAGRARIRAARQLDRQHRAVRADLRQSRRRIAGNETAGAGGADRHGAFHAQGRQRGRCRRDQGGRQSAARREASGHPRRPRVARSRRLEQPRRAGRTPGRARRHRSENRRVVPDRPPAARRRARRHDAGAGSDRGHPQRRRDRQPRLARRRRHLQELRRQARRQGHPGVARSSPAQWLEHGLSGPAAGRRVHRLRAGRRRARVARSARAGRAARTRPGRRGNSPSSAPAS